MGRVSEMVARIKQIIKAKMRDPESFSPEREAFEQESKHTHTHIGKRAPHLFAEQRAK